jgi:Ykl077w/Psg1 (Pma1 Stabilization in Golgi)
MVGLQYNNGSSKAPYMSDPMPKERGVTLVTIDQSWLDGWNELNLTLVWVAYSAGSSSSSTPLHLAYNITLVPKPVQHLPASIHNGKPSKESLMIALPIVLGFVILLVLGLLFGMRSHRRIAIGSIMGRGRHGYGTNKSRRQRLGIKKGAIRLEDRDITGPDFRDHQSEEITPAPRQPWETQGAQIGIQPGQPHHQRDLSLGSLLTDESGGNSFRVDTRAH